jgi:hypothetical protein
MREIVMDKWVRIAERSYELRCGDIQAFVFGAKRLQLWGWVVFGRGVKVAGVELGNYIHDYLERY